MSTRAHIAFFDAEPEAEQVTKPTVLIYKHSDGYPEGTLPQLTEFSKLFNEHRGLRDNEYATARCVQFMTNFDDEAMKEWRKEMKMEKEFSFLGYGVGTVFHGDIEFYYVVTPEEIKVYEVNYNFDEEDEEKRYLPKLTLVDTVTLKKETV
jgi:hypothetical protein